MNKIKTMVPILFFLGLIFTGYASAAEVSQPVLLNHMSTQTSWFGSPIIHNLGSGGPKLIGTYYKIYVWDSEFNLLDTAESGSSYPHEGRIYSPRFAPIWRGTGSMKSSWAATTEKWPPTSGETTPCQ